MTHVKVEDFITSSNRVAPIPEDEYKRIDLLINTFDALARATYQSLYIIDYNKNNFLHVSKNNLYLCGHNAEEVKELGYIFYLNHVPVEEQPLLIEINRVGFKFMSLLKPEEKLDYTMYYDFHLIHEGKKMLVNHKITPLLLSPDGNIWLAACIFSLSPHQKAGNIEMRKISTNKFWEYCLKSHKWKEKEGISLNTKEKQILTLSAQGYTVSEIASQICVSVDTVKFYKKRLFNKLGVKNITEALTTATIHQLL